MSKRFGDTNIWKKQRWFRKLHPNHKLAFLYIKDQCDHAGIWNIDCTDLVEDLGIDDFDFNQFIESCNTEYDKTTGKKSFKERLRVLDKGYVWVTGFIQFQYKGKHGLVNPYAAPVKTALQILIAFGLLEDAIKGYITLTEPLSNLPEGYLTPKDKDKEKDKNVFKKGGVGENRNGKGEKAVRLDSERMIAFFADDSCQRLGPDQIDLLERGQLSPQAVIRNQIY